MPKVLSAVWTFLDGKKTAIGALLQLVADVLALVLAALPAVAPVLGWEAVTVVSVTAKIAMVLGLVHRAVKWLGAVAK